MTKKYTNKFDSFSEQTYYYRTFAIVFMFFGFTYLAWLGANLNKQNLALAITFFAIQIINYFSVILSMINHWSFKYRKGSEKNLDILPSVAVAVPVYKEPISIIKKTLESILEIEYNGKIIVVLSNDFNNSNYISELENLINQIKINLPNNFEIHFRNTTNHDDAKAGNLNQVVEFLRQNNPDIDLILTQDADEIVYPHIINKLINYFSSPNVAYVQSIKQVKVPSSDPFGNRDYMFYARTAAARDKDNAMFACGSGVMWRLSALESIGGFSNWNLVEDLTTSYELLSQGWESRYHYEPLSRGLAPEDLPNFIKQRGTWAMDTMRLFFWKNPIFRKGLSLKQKLHFLEIPMFYINGISLMFLAFVTSFSLIFEVWPTGATAIDHAVVLLPVFLSLELYYITLADKIPFYRTRQYWVGLAPVFLKSTIKALFYGPKNKPNYKVTRKTNSYGNYLAMAWPQLLIIAVVTIATIKSIFLTPIYSAFDWATFFWGLYMASYFLQFIKVSLWKWNHSFDLSFGVQRRVTLSYAPETL